MDDLRHNLHLSQPAATHRNVRRPQPPGRLGRTLAEAREEKQLDLRDLSEITNIRLTHLEALEAGRYDDLPEDVYSKNFVRLYAQAVGLDPARMLLLYAQERRRAAAPVAQTGLELPPESVGAPLLDNPRLGQLLRPLLGALLVVGTVALALWAFNGLLAPTPRTAPVEQAEVTPPAITQSETTPPETVPDANASDVLPLDARAPNADARETVAAADAAPGTAPAANPMVLLSLRTVPPGAEVSIDGYRFGQSPIVDAPVRAGERTLRVERGGYTTFERSFDLSGNRHLSIELTPSGRSATESETVTATPTPIQAQTQAQTQAQDAATPTAPAASGITITVTAEAWLEVYRGSSRGEGARLVYETAQPGDSFTFAAPVYIFSGNAGGVLVSQGDAEAVVLGAPGTVIGQAYR
jgi:cytoskeleton protein RodZ